MKKYYFLLLLLVFVVTLKGCEKDDFCIDDITPNLIIRFYDIDNPTELKSVTDLIVTPDGLEEILNTASTDSIAIPLDVTSNQTIYNFTMGTEQDQITINYDINEVFVSRSCGIKAIFTNVTFTSNNVWIDQILPDTAITIEDETAAHIQIFH